MRGWAGTAGIQPKASKWEISAPPAEAVWGEKAYHTMVTGNCWLGVESPVYDVSGKAHGFSRGSMSEKRALHGDSSAGELALQRFKEILPLKGEYL